MASPPSNKIVIIHELRCSWQHLLWPPLSLYTFLCPQASHLTTRVCFPPKWKHNDAETGGQGKRINWLDTQASSPAGVLTQWMLLCHPQPPPSPSEGRSHLEGIIYKRLEAVCLLSELTENSSLIIKINNGIQSNFPSQGSGRLSCNQSLEVNSQGIHQVKGLAPPSEGKRPCSYQACTLWARCLWLC